MVRGTVNRRHSPVHSLEEVGVDPALRRRKHPREVEVHMKTSGRARGLAMPNEREATPIATGGKRGAANAGFPVAIRAPGRPGIDAS